MPDIREWRICADYWRGAWLKRPKTSLFAPWRAVPSVLVALCQYFISRRQQNVHQMLISVAIILAVYLGLYILEAGFNVVVRTPAIVNHVRSQELRSKDSELVTLQRNLADLKAPKLTPFQEEEYQRVKLKISGYNDLEKDLLRYLMRHQKITEHHHMGIHPVLQGYRKDQIVQILNKLLADDLLTHEIHNNPHGWEGTYTISSAVRPFLEELL